MTKCRGAPRFFDSVEILPVTYDDALAAAAMMRNRGSGLVDCHIAAAQRMGARVVTCNRKDFERTGAPG